jgi:ABC-type cobalamin/Fe3+-siderophores transport system ATPase subunit
MSSSIEVQNLTVEYGKKQVLRSCSFSCPHPCIVAVLGGNGAGKSSLLRALGGLISFRGSVTLPFPPLSFAPSSAYLPQELPLNRGQNITVQEFLAIAHPRKLRLRGIWNSGEIEARLAQYNLEHVVNQRLRELSGGEKRMLLLLATFMLPSSLALLDEPTNHLDTSRKILAAHHILQESQKQKRTCIIATHDLSFALAVADYLLLLESGTTVLYGRTSDVLKEQEFISRYGKMCRVQFADDTVRFFPQSLFEPLSFLSSVS